VRSRANKDALPGLLNPLRAERMRAYPVSSNVDSVNCPTFDLGNT
jgi:hypothetical protein